MSLAIVIMEVVSLMETLNNHCKYVEAVIALADLRSNQGALVDVEVVRDDSDALLDSAQEFISMLCRLR